MKTMKKGDSVKRVKEKEVDSHLKDGYAYCPKSEYKQENKKEGKGK